MDEIRSLGGEAGCRGVCTDTVRQLRAERRVARHFLNPRKYKNPSGYPKEFLYFRLLARSFRASHVEVDRTAVDFASVEFSDSLLGFLCSREGYESEAFLHRNVHVGHGSNASKVVADHVLGSSEGKVADEQAIAIVHSFRLGVSALRRSRSLFDARSVVSTG